MNRILRRVIYAFSFSCAVSLAQEVIPVAEPVEDPDAPLKSDPGKDMLKIADVLFLQAQESKSDPEEYRRLMGLAAQRYSEYVQANPQAADVPIVLYRMAGCLMDAGQSAQAYQVFGTIVQRYQGDPAAAAAYKLATEAYKTSDWNNAERFYTTAVQQSTKAEFKVDAAYRLGRVYLELKNKAKAAEQFRYVISNPQVQPVFKQAAISSLATLLSEEGKNEAAYGLYKQLLAEEGLTANVRGAALLRAASLASILNKPEEAQTYYDQIINNPTLTGNTAEAQLGMMMGLFKQGKYGDVVKFYDQGQIESPNQELEAKKRMLVGQSLYQLKDYERAVSLFTLAEKAYPHTEAAMEAAYRRLICENELKQPDFPFKAQNFLNNYARAYPSSPWSDMVRLMAAENLFSSNPAQAAAFYEAINLDRIDPSLRADILYKDSWACAKAGNREKALTLLSKFIEAYPQDTRIPVAYAFRGDMYVQTGREVEAMRDFDEVIKRWPRNEAAALAWQKRAQIYNRKQDILNMIKSYEGLLENFPKAMPAALAEARFMVGRGYFDRKEFGKAISNLEEARTLNPEKYGEQADMLMILSYYQLQDVARLKDSLEGLRAKDPASLKRVPEAILAWLGMQAFSSRDFETADRYLTLSTQNNELRRAKRIIWKNLAKARLALKRYETALVASNFYLQEETQPYGKVEGLLDKASILLGLGKYAEARKAAEEGLAVGVEGPLMATLKIVLGDIAYAEKKYDEAAKFYATTAELFVSDKELKPEALYKAHAALMKAGRVADAAPYKAALEKDFPGWTPSETQQLP